MSSLFGGGDDSASQEMLQMQKDEAAEARKKEEDRKGRINSGLARINAMFSKQGVETTAPKTFDWKTFNPATVKAGAVPGMSGFSFVQQPGTPAKAAVYGPGHYTAQNLRDNAMSGAGGSNPLTGSAGGDIIRRGRDDTGSGQQQAPGSGTPGVNGYGTPGSLISPAVAATGPSWMIKGPDGKMYKVGDVVSGNVGTGKYTGGFGDDFYNKFKEGVTNYYLPQVAEKYGDAKDETTYRLARAGTLKSTMANELVADLAKQNAIQVGNVRSKADSGAADLLGRVNAAKTNAVNQLYSTENPDVAINQATSAIKNITPAPTDLSPLADIFNVATIGAARGIQGYNDRKFVAANQDIFGKSGSGRVVG